MTTGLGSPHHTPFLSLWPVCLEWVAAEGSSGSDGDRAAGHGPH